MKILSLYVENFGGLHQFSLQLSDGITTLLRPNGWGKSSLAVFIKAMLYGLPASTRRSLIENERKRYTPWQGGVYGGSMDVAIGDRQLRIERTFGAKESEDTLTLTDLMTGAPLSEIGQAPGEMWFGIDAAAYERSTYISQRETDESDGNLSIHAKLNRLLDVSDDLVSFDHAMELLENQRKYYALNNGRRGAIADDEDREAYLQDKRDACQTHAEKAAECERRLRELEEQRVNLRTEAQALHEKEQAIHQFREKQAQKQTWQHWIALAEQAEGEYEQALRSMGGQLPTEQMQQKLDALERQLRTAYVQREDLRSRLDSQQPWQQELSDLTLMFGEHLPDEQEWQSLRQHAARAGKAYGEWRAVCRLSVQTAQNAQTHTMENASKKQDLLKEQDLLPDAWQLHHFFLQYSAQKDQLAQQKLQQDDVFRAATEQAGRSLRCQKLQNKIFFGMAALGFIGSLALLFWQPIWSVIPLIGTFVLVLVGIVQGKKQNLLYRQALQTVEDSCRANVALTKEQEQLQSQWNDACQRIKRQLGVQVTDAAQAQEVLTNYQNQIAIAMARQDERKAAEASQNEKAKELQQHAKTEFSAFLSKWHWNAPISPEDAPVEVERMVQQAARYEQLKSERGELNAQMLKLDEQIALWQEKRQELLRDCDCPSDADAALWIKARCETAIQSARAAQEYRERADNYAKEHGMDCHQNASESDKDEKEKQEQEEMSLEPSDASTVEECRRLLQEKEEALHREMANCRREWEDHTAQCAELDTVEAELADLQTKIAAEKASLATLLATQKYLKQAKEQLSGRYLVRMRERFASYLTSMTGEAETTFTMDGNFSVKIRCAGITRSQDSFSVGWRDIIALCARLALVDVLFDEESPFLILDDPLTNMDDETASRAKEILQQAAKKHQILYLTCHSSRTP